MVGNRQEEGTKRNKRHGHKRKRKIVMGQNIGK